MRRKRAGEMVEMRENNDGENKEAEGMEGWGKMGINFSGDYVYTCGCGI